LRHFSTVNQFRRIRRITREMEPSAGKRGRRWIIHCYGRMDIWTSNFFKINDRAASLVIARVAAWRARAAATARAFGAPRSARWKWR
jgi:hypothetical protein